MCARACVSCLCVSFDCVLVPTHIELHYDSDASRVEGVMAKVSSCMCTASMTSSHTLPHLRC